MDYYLSYNLQVSKKKKTPEQRRLRMLCIWEMKAVQEGQEKDVT